LDIAATTYLPLAASAGAGAIAWAWIKFALLAGVIIIAGLKLTRYGDVFTEKFNLSHGFVGFIFIGWATSLPEMVITVSSIVGLETPNPNYAIGNIFGSCYFNLFIIALVAAVFGIGPFFSKVDRNLVLSCALSMIMVLTAMLGLVVLRIFPDYVRTWDPFGGMGYHVSIFAFIILAMYFVFSWMVFRHDRHMRLEGEGPSPEPKGGLQYADWSTGWTVVKALIAAGAIVLAGVFLTYTGDTLASKEYHDLDASLIGTLFFAIVSSLPELVTALGAARLFLYDMAVGSIFGSNIFNLMILALADLLYVPATIFDPERASPKHLVTGVFVLVLSSLCIVGLVYRTKRKIGRVGLDVIAIIVVYFIGIYLIFVMKGG
jgi:cation:H+ antiporter